MLLHFLSFFVFSFQLSPGNLGGASCKTQGHFTNAYLEISTGSLQCSDSNWGFPEIKIKDDPTVSKFELSTNEGQKYALNEFKTALTKSNDMAKESILKQLSVGEKLISANSVSYEEYNTFQEEYVKQIQRLSDRNANELSRFFK